MMKNKYTILVFIIGLSLLNLADARRSKELDYASLETDYNNLVHNEKYKNYAKTEKRVAKLSVEALINNQVKRKNRAKALYIAQHNIAYARLVAEEQWLQNEIAKEKEIAHNYEVSISKTEAEIARHDAEVARMMLIAQQEEAQRATQRAKEAELLAQDSLSQAELAKQETEAAKRLAKARKEEAELAKQEAELALLEAKTLRRKLNTIATKKTDKGLMMTLGDFVFDSGRSSIKKEAKQNFSKVVAFINTYPNKKVRIEGHTDSSGSKKLNLKLSKQ
ncbi:MAG TPA: hypothetical protein ENJ44_04565, partial [Oceanospirillales bacterium]|nr:hypothetical protein [Oceanospirillales bacterium]